MSDQISQLSILQSEERKRATARNPEPFSFEWTCRACGFIDLPPVEEQEAYWNSLDEGRSDGHGESYAERNA